MRLAIIEDDIQRPDVLALLARHLEFASSVSPPESTHALDVDGLRSPQVTFWTAWQGDALVGCGALKQLDPNHGEVKSMHTAEVYRGQGVGTVILQHVLTAARQRGYRRVSLETGSQPEFAPSRALYAANGFTVCAPFAIMWRTPTASS